MARRRRARTSWCAGWCAGALAAAVSVAPAFAREVRFPEKNPVVTLDVPDGWTVSYTAIGLELRSPEKDSFIVADLFKHKRAAAEAWQKRAEKVMEAEGLSFDKASVKNEPRQDAKDKPAVLPPPSDAFIFSGTPSISLPGSIAPVIGTTADVPSVAPGFGTAVKNGIPHKIVTFKGGSFGGKPVDVQLYVFSLRKDELFLIQQESGKSDSRAVAIVYSLKTVH